MYIFLVYSHLDISAKDACLFQLSLHLLTGISPAIFLLKLFVNAPSALENVYCHAFLPSIIFEYVFLLSLHHLCLFPCIRKHTNKNNLQMQLPEMIKLSEIQRYPESALFFFLLWKPREMDCFEIPQPTLAMLSLKFEEVKIYFPHLW